MGCCIRKRNPSNPFEGRDSWVRISEDRAHHTDISVLRVNETRTLDWNVCVFILTLSLSYNYLPILRESLQ